MDHVLPVIVAVSTEVHTARDSREWSLLSLPTVAQATLLAGLLRGHLIGEGIWSQPLVHGTQVRGQRL